MRRNTQRCICDRQDGGIVQRDDSVEAIVL